MLSIVLSVLLSTLSCLFAGPIATKGLIIDCSRGLESVNLAEQQATACLASGPVGAVVAELSADILSPDKPLAQMKEKEQALGRKLTRQEFFELYPAVHQNYFEDVRNVHKASKIVAAIGASFIGGNTAVGAATGANAIDYNAAFAAGWGVSALAETAFGAYLVEGLAAVGGAALGAGGAVLIKEALDFIGVQAVDGGYAYRGQVYASLPDALAAVIIQNPATHAAGSMYLVAKTLLDLNHKSGLDLGDIICKDKSSQPPSGKQSSGEASWATKPCAQSYAATGGAMPPPEDPEEDSKDPKKQDGTYKTPDEKHEHIFERIKRANGAMENKLDGSIWEKDATSHGGRQYKRWDNIRSWQKREQPKSIWPDGRIRK